MTERGRLGTRSALIWGIGVALMALLGGLLIAGRPERVPNDILASEIAPPPSTTVPPTTDATTTSSTTTSTTTTTTSTSTTTTVPPTTTARATTTTARATTTTLRATTTTARPVPTTTSTTMPRPRTTTTTLPPLRQPAAVSVVVINAGGADGMAGRVVEFLNGAGYGNAVATTAIDRRPESIVYFAAGSEREARTLADLLEIVQVAPRPAGPLNVDDVTAQVDVVLGGDQLDGRFGDG